LALTQARGDRLAPFCDRIDLALVASDRRISPGRVAWQVGGQVSDLPDEAGVGFVRSEGVWPAG
jgi:hypothetical protein